MYIKKIKIENYKAIKDVELEFSNGINLIIGDNGTGKTSILEAMVVALGGYLSGITGITTKGILQSDVRYEMNNTGGVMNSPKYYSPVKIFCEVNIDDTIFTWERIRNDENGNSVTKTNDSKIAKYARDTANNEESILPILGYRSAEIGILHSKKRASAAALKAQIGNRRNGYAGCLNSMTDYEHILDWCKGMSEEEFYQERKIPVYEAFKNCIASFLQRIEDTNEVKNIRFNKFFKDMVLEEHGEIKPISVLSAGYKAILYLTMDVAFRMAILNPQVTDFTEVPGVVLIDELDMHLHPKWQWNVLNALKETFPKVQFIVATHSPIFLSSCKGAKQIIIDEDQKIEYPAESFAYSVDDVLLYRQGSRGIPKNLRDLMDQFEKAMNLDHLEEARKIYDEMQHIYGSDNTQVKTAKQDLDFWA